MGKYGWAAYGQAIIRACGCKPQDTEQIEDAMRTQHSTLDHLTATAFNRLVRNAWKAVQILREDGTLPTPNEDGTYPKTVTA